jgi:hypothetical protein
MANSLQIIVNLGQLGFTLAIVETEPDLAGMLGLTLDPGEHILRLVKLAAHTGLGEIHKMLRIMHNVAINYAVSEPGVQAQRASLGVFLATMVSNVQVYFVRQALNLAFWADNVIMDEEQVDIRGPTQQRFAAE